MRLAILLLAALPATATVVTLERDGVSVAGEVCRFRAEDAENPFKRWLASQEVTCVPAGDVAFPQGSWNVFGRIDGQAVSDPVLVENAPATLTLALKPAATLTTSRSGIAYAPRRAVAYPLGARTTVPADEELWLLVVEKSVPVALYTVPALQAGAQRNADASAAVTGVLAWLQMPEDDRVALRNASGVSSPQVRAGSRDADPLPPLSLLNGAFVLVRGVEAGDVELSVGGRGWLPHRRRASVGASSITAVTEPLLARGAASVIVHWSSTRDVPALEQSIGSCNSAGDEPAQYEVTLSRCGADGLDCTAFRTETFPPDMNLGSFTADDVVPGTYRVEARFGKLPAVSAGVAVAPFDQRDARVFVRYFELYGSLTRGGEPLAKEAALEFPGGIGFAGAGSEEYRAVILDPLPPDTKIGVTPCDRKWSATVLSDRPIPLRARFNIDVPDNKLIVTVTDTFTRELLRGATVRYAIESRFRSRPIVSRALTTGDEGRVVVESVPVREVHISVRMPGYERQEVAPFTMPSSGEKVVDVQLVPVRSGGGNGKLVSSRGFGVAAIYWVLPNGMLTERAEVAEDGTFTFNNAHGPSETMAVVSLTHPLWVRRSPSMDLRDQVNLPFPDAPARTFGVRVRASRADINLVVGGVAVPYAVLREHQALRDLPATIRESNPLLFRDIAETGPIHVILGPVTETAVRRPLVAGAKEIVIDR